MKQGIFMRALASDATEATIEIIGVIGWEVSYQEMRKLIKSIPDTVSKVFFDIYSPGGNVWEGNGIIQDIGAMKQETVARVQVAASMATLIAVACKTREIAANGRWLIHNPWAELMGDAGAMEKRAKELRDCEQEAAMFYAKRTGKTVEEMLKLMAEERWLTPAETKEMGFVQSINDPFDVAAYADVKAEIVAAGKWPKALVEMPVIETEPIKIEEQKMEEKKNDANTTGAAGDGATAVIPPVQSASEEVIKAADASGYERGLTEGETSAKAQYAAQLGAVADQVVDLKGKFDVLEILQRKTQGERDSARAQGEKLNAALKDATAHLERLLSGGMSFAPAVEGWADALKVCNGEYEKARKQFPDLYRASRDQDKSNRK